jgi:pimeloyl-ACP methyl ester carboxylesterase
MVREAGAPDGRTVVFFHGTPGSRLDASAGDGVAASVGVRIVSVDRPGYGHSDPTRTSLCGVAHDVEVFTDTLGVDRFGVLAVSGGGPFALATSALMAARVSYVGLVAAPGPYLEVPGAMDQWSEEDVRLARGLPQAADRVVEKIVVDAQPLLAMRDDDKALRGWVETVLGGVDVHAMPTGVIDSEVANLKESLRQGATGLAWDNVAWSGPWGFDLAEVRCPVSLWYGDSDPLVPSFHGEWFAAHLPNVVEFVVVPGAGHLALMRHWGDMLRVVTQQTTTLQAERPEWGAEPSSRPSTEERPDA